MNGTSLVPLPDMTSFVANVASSSAPWFNSILPLGIVILAIIVAFGAMSWIIATIAGLFTSD